MAQETPKTGRLLLALLIVLALLATACGSGASPSGQNPLDTREPEPARPAEETSSGLCAAPLASLLLLGLAAVAIDSKRIR